MATLNQRRRNRKNLSKLIREVIAAYKCNLNEIAKDLGVNEKTFSAWNTGRSSPRSEDEYKRVTNYLKDLLINVTPAQLPLLPSDSSPPKEVKPVTVSALNVQVGGNHYKDSAIQPIQYIEANKLDFLEGCVVKRVTRHNKPSGKGVQDIDKAIHELHLLKELRYGITTD